MVTSGEIIHRRMVRNRLKEVCPEERFSEMDIDEVEKATRVAFKIIGYNPENFSDAFRKSWESFEDDELWKFIFLVWRNSDG